MKRALNISSLLSSSHFSSFLPSSFTRKRVLAVFAFASLGAATLAVWGALQLASRQEPTLAAMLPKGALLTIEAKDFAAILKQWNDSPQKSAWLKSDSYSVFSNSRLFGRLGGAQAEFAHAVGLPPDLNFLKEVAGTRSIFAWYDIGNLEFLYITRIPSAAAEQTHLLQMRSRFTPRQIGNQTFYVRTQTDADTGGQPKTVAFATAGDWLLLATREDLMAGALTLMTAPANSTDSLAAEPWFADAQASAKDPGHLRMTLNLEKIVPSPYFRSYWIQSNVTEMKQFRSAIADLHIESQSFREERVLLPKAPLAITQGAETGAVPDLSPLLNLLPERSGVYRAEAAPSTAMALASLNAKLLERGISGYSNARYAPVADLAVQQAGSSSDSGSFETHAQTQLDTRIDAAPLAHPVAGAELSALRQMLEGSAMSGMLTLSRTGALGDGLWVPFQSAIVLASNRDWDQAAVQTALEQDLAANLTTGHIGLGWKPVHSSSGDFMEISQARPLELAFRGKLCIVADSPELMQELLARADAAAAGSATGKELAEKELVTAQMVAGFETGEERTAFSRWAKLVDGQAGRNASQALPGTTDVGTNAGNGLGSEPAFFSQNMRSLGAVFAGLQSERIIVRQDGLVTRQTVTYKWRP